MRQTDLDVKVLNFITAHKDRTFSIVGLCNHFATTYSKMKSVLHNLEDRNFVLYNPETHLWRFNPHG